MYISYPIVFQRNGNEDFNRFYVKTLPVSGLIISMPRPNPNGFPNGYDAFSESAYQEGKYLVIKPYPTLSGDTLTCNCGFNLIFICKAY